MKKRELSKVIKSFLVKYPPNFRENRITAFKALTEIKGLKLPNEFYWKWLEIYKEGRILNEIVEDILNPTKKIAARREPNVAVKPRSKEDLDLYYKEAELILFRPSTVLKMFKIDMAPGLFMKKYEGKPEFDESLFRVD